MAIPGSPATKQRIRARPCAAARFHWRAFPGSVYRPRRPTQTPLYQVVQHHVETFLARSSESDPTGYGLPESALPHAMHALRGGPGVERDFRGYLECGILAHGFARARCEDCGHERLIPFSCKGRGICPSCNARHMREVAAHLTDHVLPHVPTRRGCSPYRSACVLTSTTTRGSPAPCSRSSYARFAPRSGARPLERRLTPSSEPSASSTVSARPSMSIRTILPSWRKANPVPARRGGHEHLVRGREVGSPRQDWERVASPGRPGALLNRPHASWLGPPLPDVGTSIHTQRLLIGVESKDRGNQAGDIGRRAQARRDACQFDQILHPL